MQAPRNTYAITTVMRAFCTLLGHSDMMAGRPYDPANLLTRQAQSALTR
jgi:hypothetical protein